jgi:uncharacterized protein (TIGR02271 family)
MKRTITAMFDSYADARRAVERLESAGVPHADISIVSNDSAHREHVERFGRDGDHTGEGAGTGATLGGLLGGGAGLLAGLGMLAIPGLGPVVAAGWLATTLVGAGAGAAAGGLVGSLVGAGVSEADAHTYAEGVRRGGTLVTVRGEENMRDRILDILDDEGTVDLDEREAMWKREGWSGRFGGSESTTGLGALGEGRATQAGGGSAGMATTHSSATSARTGHDEVIPVAEERLTVGKRETNEGRVRVRSYVVETPVEEQVSLRREHVEVERRPATGRAATGDVFQERTIEAVEKSEVPVVAKEARVTEELVVKKHADERTETVRDTVRKTEVEIEDERHRQSRTGTSGGTEPTGGSFGGSTPRR